METPVCSDIRIVFHEILNAIVARYRQDQEVSSRAELSSLPPALHAFARSLTRDHEIGWMRSKPSAQRDLGFDMFCRMALRKGGCLASLPFGQNLMPAPADYVPAGRQVGKAHHAYMKSPGAEQRASTQGCPDDGQQSKQKILGFSPARSPL